MPVPSSAPPSQPAPHGPHCVRSVALVPSGAPICELSPGPLHPLNPADGRLRLRPRSVRDLHGSRPSPVRTLSFEVILLQPRRFRPPNCSGDTVFQFTQKTDTDRREPPQTSRFSWRNWSQTIPPGTGNLKHGKQRARVLSMYRAVAGRGKEAVRAPLHHPHSLPAGAGWAIGSRQTRRAEIGRAHV